MIRQMMWQALYAPGFEHSEIVFTPEGLTASGLVIGVENDLPFRIRYQISTYPDGSVSTVEIVDLWDTARHIELYGDDTGEWTDAADAPLAELNGCLDVDISVTPLTNTLPIRRLRPQVGETHTIQAVYIEIPQMQVSAAEQRYTCLSTSPQGTLYRYEQNEFQADVLVDKDGLVVNYAGLFKRVWSC